MGMKPDFSGPISEDLSSLNKSIDNSQTMEEIRNSEDSGSDSDTLSASGSEDASGSKFSNTARPKGETLEQKKVRFGHFFDFLVTDCFSFKSLIEFLSIPGSEKASQTRKS